MSKEKFQATSWSDHVRRERVQRNWRQSDLAEQLGGIGKTQIAVEYAYRAAEQEHFTHILWLQEYRYLFCEKNKL